METPMLPSSGANELKQCITEKGKTTHLSFQYISMRNIRIETWSLYSENKY